MSTFVAKAEFKDMIRDDRLNQLIDSDDTLIESAEDTAIAVIKDALKARYDIDTIFAAVGAARANNVMLWVKRLTIYFLYDRIPDELVPERVIRNYDEAMDQLNKISDGKRAVDLPQLSDADGVTITKFRWGSNTATSH